MASELQKIESNAVINKIAIGKLYQEGFSFLTIHDSVIVPKSKHDLVKKTIWEPVLRGLGFPEFLEDASKPMEEYLEPVEEFSEIGKVLFG